MKTAPRSSKGVNYPRKRGNNDEKNQNEEVLYNDTLTGSQLFGNRKTRWMTHTRARTRFVTMPDFFRQSNCAFQIARDIGVR